MKIWNGYGSEHSANLVMIGRFQEPDGANKVKEIIDEITRQVDEDSKADANTERSGTGRYSEPMLALLTKLNVHSIGPAELEQFQYDVRIAVEKEELVLTTDELEVSAFLKVLIDHGARIEVYSAHNYENTGHGR